MGRNATLNSDELSGFNDKKIIILKLSHRSQNFTFEFLELKIFEKKTKNLNKN